MVYEIYLLNGFWWSTTTVNKYQGCVIHELSLKIIAGFGLSGEWKVFPGWSPVVWHRALALSGPHVWQIRAQRVSPAQVGGCTGHSPHSNGMFDTQAKACCKICCCAEHGNLPTVLCCYRKGFRKSAFSHYLQKIWERAGLSVQQTWISQLQLSKCWWVLSGAL